VNRDILLPFAIAVVIVAAITGSPPDSQAEHQKIDLSQIHGRIQFVTAFPDFKVQIVGSFPDLKVQKVESFPDKPGCWQVVNSFPDYKIQIVESFPDFTIQYVESFPGPAR
jgi:hypothetical protein